MNSILLASILATYRLTVMLKVEQGPFRIFVRMREILGIMHDCEYVPVAYPDNMIGGLFECFWCLSVWISALFTLLLVSARLPWWNYPILWLANSAGTCVIGEFVTWLSLAHGED